MLIGLTIIVCFDVNGANIIGINFKQHLIIINIKTMKEINKLIIKEIENWRSLAIYNLSQKIMIIASISQEKNKGNNVIITFARETANQYFNDIQHHSIQYEKFDYQKQFHFKFLFEPERF